MKKVILTYGLIAGSIAASLMFITIPLWKSGAVNFDNGELIGYTGMVIALSMVFFGIKSFRDNHLEGAITFWKGVQVGILIALIASVMYALAWEVAYRNLPDDFIQRMTDHYFTDLKEGGATEEELNKAREKWASFNEYYKIPIVRFGVSVMEIFPVGLVITLASAAILRKKEILPL